MLQREQNNASHAGVAKGLIPYGIVGFESFQVALILNDDTGAVTDGAVPGLGKVKEVFAEILIHRGQAASRPDRLAEIHTASLFRICKQNTAMVRITDLPDVFNNLTESLTNILRAAKFDTCLEDRCRSFRRYVCPLC